MLSTEGISPQDGLLAEMQAPPRLDTDDEFDEDPMTAFGQYFIWYFHVQNAIMLGNRAGPNFFSCARGKGS